MGKKKVTHEEHTQIVLPQGTDAIGKVKTMYGSDRLLVQTKDGRQLICRIIGKLRKRVWIRADDIVLVSPWDFDPKRGDVFYRYTRDQVKELKRRGIYKE